MARRRRGLSEDDLEVWRAVSRTMTPLHPTGAPIPAPTPPVPEPKTKGADAPTIPAFRVGEKGGKKTSGHVFAPTPGQTLAAMPLTMDAKTHKKMRQGKLKPEAKLDLHGLTLAQAHPALIGFIHRAHGDGLRLVLIVTGKGKDRDTPGPIPTPRGLLKHNVPQWLNAPPLRPMVLQVTDAHIRHGGTGAYYVYLRRSG